MSSASFCTLGLALSADELPLLPAPEPLASGAAAAA
jgi:hypothetical protein